MSGKHKSWRSFTLVKEREREGEQNKTHLLITSRVTLALAKTGAVNWKKLFVSRLGDDAPLNCTQDFESVVDSECPNVSLVITDW